VYCVIFEFKQFSLQQKNTRVRIGFDAVLLGVLSEAFDGAKILDIGAGTGVIGCMLASRYLRTQLTGIEPDPYTFEDLQANYLLFEKFATCRGINSKLQEFSLKSEDTFDVIVCNPPFHTESIKPDQAERLAWRHNDQLPFVDLMQCASELMSAEGVFYLVIPYRNWRLINRLALKNGLFLYKAFSVITRPGGEATRFIGVFCRQYTGHDEYIMRTYDCEDANALVYRDLLERCFSDKQIQQIIRELPL
jgi:tRNA1Val (adenine37-N6)-methyltransferase